MGIYLLVMSSIKANGVGTTYLSLMNDTTFLQTESVFQTFYSFAVELGLVRPTPFVENYQLKYHQRYVVPTPMVQIRY
ncbi:MAG: hypothetical protein AAF573_01120 [Bacteroidota bacterium]